MAVTMHDVARRAGVSVKTVSNVVNDYPHIRPATRDRVMAAIAELGYQLNASARNLRRGRTGIVGLVVPTLSLPYFAELAESVIEVARARGLVVIIEQTGNSDRERELESLHSSRRTMTDGLIFSPLALGPDDEQLLPTNPPLVLLGERIFSDRVDHVTMRNTEAGQAATEYLLGLGRRRIAVIGSHEGEVVGSAALRTRGYELALQGAGLPLDPSLYGEAGPWTRAAGAESIGRMLDSGVRPDAVFALNDTLAIGAMHEILVRGLTVPGDIAVIGFDDIEEAEYSAPPLTSVHFGREEIASAALDLLEARIAGRSAEPCRHDAPFHIAERGSTMPHS
ncbi:LacI family DNA-binding transcriptional regulator [Bogoriella caseilytica]|uniref:LacI family transcriptional regulator n=1 Tax=Bogoriella caseilytica TaxID=56055 RepID=A0A3N2BF97_9MICO|nr:LacI family DNA-binding transcriptional regulator [Bogoriella caseilytica]ROR73928.1 LacI family transcriptional regulator [Bogoriella caseilytica]